MSGFVEGTLTSQPNNNIGVLDDRFDKEQPLIHFRGIKYASIPERFAAPVLEKRQPESGLKATKFGPRCPQIPVDVRDLMQIPKDLESFPPETEDEFECLNLNITAPVKNDKQLPVLIWIYGGAQVVSFSTPAHRLCETGPFVAQSIAAGQPIILVTPNYRLNVLAYGDGSPSSERNLHIQDLKAAVQWTVDNIAMYGGDTARISIAGESAGSILTHALCLSLPPTIPVHRAILCSGSIGTSRFQPPSFFAPTLDRILTTAKGLAVQQGHPEADSLTLRTLPIPLLVASMAASAMNNIPLQQSSAIPKDISPQAAFNRLDALMIGDCEFEGILWLAGIRLIPSDTIRNIFEGDSPSDAIKRLTSAYLDQSTTSIGHNGLGITPDQAAAVSFMADYLFHLPNTDIIRSLNSTISDATSDSEKPPKVYTYLFDQPNPFSTSAQHSKPGTGVPRAHHGVDLLALWDGYGTDYPSDSPFTSVAKAYRSRILAFVNGEEPWSASSAVAEQQQGTNAYMFGPDGTHGEITADEYKQLRRTEAIEVMRDVGQDTIDLVFGRLIAEIGKQIARVMKEMGLQSGSKAGDGAEADEKTSTGDENKGTSRL